MRNSGQTYYMMYNTVIHEFPPNSSALWVCRTKNDIDRSMGMMKEILELQNIPYTATETEVSFKNLKVKMYVPEADESPIAGSKISPVPGLWDPGDEPGYWKDPDSTPIL